MIHEGPFVTTIIRTYNRADILGNAIESILNQTYKNFELIILDDCSSDNTKEVVLQYQKKDTRINYIRHEKNYGTGKGFNTANDAANGKYVAYLDDDDTWRKDKLEKQVKKFESCSNNVGMITGGVQHWNSDTGYKLGQFIPNKRGNVYWESLGKSGDIFGPPSVTMIRKSVFDNIGQFREDMPRGCCQQYFRRIAKTHEIDFTEDILIDYYFHKDAITSIVNIKDLKKAIVSMQIKIESTESDLKKVPFIYADELRKLGNYLCLSGEFKEGGTVFVKALKYDRFSTPIIILLLGSKTKHLRIYKIAELISSKFRHIISKGKRMNESKT